MKQATLNLLSRALIVLVLGLGIHPAAARAAGDRQANIRKDYQPIVLEADGSAKAAALDALVSGLRPEVKAQSPVVVMVHGYDQTVEESSRDYAATA